MSPTFPFLPPVLVTESAEEQAKLYQAVEREMMAMGFIDAMYVSSFVSITFEIARYEACKVDLIDMSMCQVLQELQSPPIRAPEQERSDCVEVSAISQLKLNEGHIRAIAIRRCFKELKALNDLIISLELRRTRVLRMSVEYREGWGRLLEKSTGQVMDGKIAWTLDRHPELQSQIHEAMRKDDERWRWSFAPNLEKGK
jgi:hypothetical protein